MHVHIVTYISKSEDQCFYISSFQKIWCHSTKWGSHHQNTYMASRYMTMASTHVVPDVYHDITLWCLREVGRFTPTYKAHTPPVVA